MQKFAATVTSSKLVFNSSRADNRPRATRHCLKKLEEDIGETVTDQSKEGVIPTLHCADSTLSGWQGFVSYLFRKMPQLFFLSSRLSSWRDSNLPIQEGRTLPPILRKINLTKLTIEKVSTISSFRQSRL